METIFSLAIGLGLAAACGFRVFLPLLGLGIGGATGAVTISDGFSWVATTPALLALGTAAAAEIAGYFVPWVDHALDALATPVAVAAGVLAVAAVAVDVPPLLRWAIAVIGGGGVAGLLQGATVLWRAKSTTLTAGLGNPVVATLEVLAAGALAALAILAPLLGVLVVLAVIIWSVRATGSLLFGRSRGRSTGKR